MYSILIILSIISLTYGEVPICSEILGDEVQEISSINPDTDMYDKGKLNATMSIPIFETTENWNIVMKLSRTIDSLTSDIANVTGDNTVYNLHSLEDNGKLEKYSVLALPFVIEYTGGSPVLEILSVDINDKNICNKPMKNEV